MTPDPDHAKAGAVGDLGDPSLLDADAVTSALGADLEHGLTAQEASRRLAQNGPNQLRATPRQPTWRRILAQFQDPLIYLLLAAVVIALVAWVIEGRGAQNAGWPVDAIVIAAIVLLNGVLGHVQEAKAENAVAALAKMTAATSSVLRDGKPQRVPSAELAGARRAAWPSTMRSSRTSLAHMRASITRSLTWRPCRS